MHWVWKKSDLSQCERIGGGVGGELGKILGEYEWNPLPMNPRTSMGWEQALHSGFLCRRKDGRERKTASMNERWGGGGGGGGCWKLMWGGGGGRCTLNPKSHLFLLEGLMGIIVRYTQQEKEDCERISRGKKQTKNAEREKPWWQRKVQKANSIQALKPCERIDLNERHGPQCVHGALKAWANAQSERVVFISWVWGLFYYKVRDQSS